MRALLARLLALCGIGKPKPVPRRAVCVNVPSPSALVDAALKQIKPPMVRTSLYVDQWLHEPVQKAKMLATFRHYQALGYRVVVCLTGENLSKTLDEAIPLFVQVAGSRAPR